MECNDNLTSDQLQVSLVSHDAPTSPKLTKQKKPSLKHIKVRELNTDLLSPKSETDYNSSKIVVIGKSGTGKCFKIDTEIMMFDGRIARVQDICVGDLVMGDDSTPRRVTSLGHGRSEMFEVVLDNGSSYTVNGDHIMCLKLACNFKIERSNNMWGLHWLDHLSLRETHLWFSSIEDAGKVQKRH